MVSPRAARRRWGRSGRDMERPPTARSLRRSTGRTTLGSTETTTEPLASADVGLVFYRRKRLGQGVNLNLSKSGASVSKRVGRVTLSTRGRGSIRIAKGLSFRFKL